MTRRLAFLVAVIAVLASAATLAHADELDAGSGAATSTPVPVPPGVYLVTDVYAGSIATTSGVTTRYSTLTVHAVPGTYARLLDVVATGAASAYDGRSFNGRGRVSDGRLIAGAYYQTFVLTPVAFVPVNIVFFQDDAETRALIAPTPTAGPAAPTASPSTPAPTARAPYPTAAPAPTMPPLPVAAAGVALASDGPTLSSIDVLRARVVHLWMRAFVGGVAVPVRAWRLISMPPRDISRTTGAGSEPADVSWPYPDPDPQALRFEVTDAVYGRTVIASVIVTVRSPAIVQ